MDEKRTTTNVSHETWKRLPFKKEPGLTYDDVISNFLDKEEELEDE